MNEDKGFRVAQIRKKFELTQAEFAEKIGLKFSAISMIELGKIQLKNRNLMLICHAFGVNEAWLRDGVGEMIDDMSLLSGPEKQLFCLYKRLSPRARQMLIEYAEKLLEDEERLRENLASEPEESAEKRGAG